MRYTKGDVLTYIGHTEACKEECGAPCCPPGEGCPWEERIGKKLTVVEDLPGCNLKVEFEEEPSHYYFIRFRAHVSSGDCSCTLAGCNGIVGHVSSKKHNA